ncbi:Cas10/Cmr2 second palm domain-containing protein [Actinomyces oris]
MHLVMLETNGNQRFIFSSPRLRDSVGASSLLTKLKQWTAQELLATGAAAAWCAARGLPDGREPHESQWVSKSSGKVIFLVDTAQQAKDVIGAVTRKVLAEAPGMDVSGVFIPLPTPSDPQPGPVDVTESALKEAHAEAARYALQRPPAEARFSQLPFLARAKDSSLPASPPLSTRDEAKDDRQDALSLTSRVRRYRAYQARLDLLETGVNRSPDLSDKQALLIRDPTMLAKKLHQVFVEGIEPVGDEGRPSPEESIARGAKEFGPLERAIQSDPDASSTASPDTDSGDYTFLSKVAVIHIDGNGVGGIMKELNSSKDRVAPGVFKAEVGCDRDDPDALRRFLLAVNKRLQNAVEHAFAAAWARIDELSRHDDDRAGRRHTAIPVVPVILGGDDVTVITSGDYALPFAAAYLRYYEEATGNDPILCYLTPPEGQDTGPMTAAAGVAIVKRNFPFHIAYELAEKLVNRAKKVGKTACPPCSTLDYHVLFDTTVLDPDEAIRGYERFTTRPFRLLNDDTPSAPCTCNDCSGTAGSGDHEDSTSADSSTNDLRHAPWEATCRRVARFKGVPLGSTDESRNETDLEPFPRTRAARIRGLLSADARERAAHRDDDATDAPTAEAADRETPGSETPEKKEDQETPSHRRARDEWKAAREEVGDWIDTELGGMGAVFDLLELSDLLPPSFFPSLGEAPNTASEATE